jgi:hypothetical protein
MKKPFFVTDDSDVDIFIDEESLSRYMEVYDIESNLAFDAQGQRLQLFLSDPGGGNPIVLVKPLEHPEYQPKMLAERILKYLSAVDADLKTDNLTLDELVSVSIEKIGYS